MCIPAVVPFAFPVLESHAKRFALAVGRVMAIGDIILTGCSLLLVILVLNGGRLMLLLSELRLLPRFRAPIATTPAIAIAGCTTTHV